MVSYQVIIGRCAYRVMSMFFRRYLFVVPLQVIRQQVDDSAFDDGVGDAGQMLGEAGDEGNCEDDEGRRGRG